LQRAARRPSLTLAPAWPPLHEGECARVVSGDRATRCTSISSGLRGLEHGREGALKYPLVARHWSKMITSQNFSRDGGSKSKRVGHLALTSGSLSHYKSAVPRSWGARLGGSYNFLDSWRAANIAWTATVCPRDSLCASHAKPLL